MNLPIDQTTYIALTSVSTERKARLQPDFCISEWPNEMDYVNEEEGLVSV